LAFDGKLREQRVKVGLSTGELLRSRAVIV